jgi:fatty-acyl-CoA synthase
VNAGGPHDGDTVWSLLDRAAARFPTRPALVSPARTTSYAELAKSATSLASGLHGLGVGRADHVGVAIGNRDEWVLLYYALARLGAVAVCLSTRWSAAELVDAIARTDCRFLVIEPVVRRSRIGDAIRSAVPELEGSTWGRLASDRLPALVGIAAIGDGPPGALPWDAILDRSRAATPVDPAPVADDVAMMVFTSGSTAFPKAAMLTHGGIARNARAHSTRLRMTEEDRWCTAMPFFHVGGTIWGLGGCAAVGAAVVYLPAFDGAEVLRTIERERCTINFGVETMLRDELAVPDFDRYDLTSLRISSAGAPSELRREVRRRFGVKTILSMYGMTEAHANVAVTGPDDTVERQDTTMGRPHAEVSVAIADPLSRRRLPAGAEGEIVLKGRGVFAGYYGQPDETAALFDEDGWLRSGDLGTVDPDGYLSFRGRSKEMIRVGGENVSLLEVETVAMRHPAIERAYAIGVPDDRLVETVAIFARPRSAGALTPDALRQHCADRLAGYKVPRHIFFVDEFPLGESGRVSKARLRERALQALGRSGE